jgi:hypothetical protein
MAIATTAQRNNLADAYGDSATHAALFTADPGTSGSISNEVSGGSPAYARKAITWSAPTNGVVTGTVTFDVPAGTTVTYAGVTSAATSGTLLDRVAVTNQAFSAQGTYTLTLTYTQS